MAVRVSILISTLNRAQYLRRALLALRYLDHDSFEAVVVNGPSEDRTDAVLEEFQDFIKIGRCQVRHIARSRNVSLKMAHGDFVAFLDDDSVPEPKWLRNLMAGFDTEEVAGVGGTILGSDGITPQYQYITSNRFGESTFNESPPADLVCMPFNEWYPALPGSNCMFRKRAIMEVGGFDEEYEYHLEETDLCARLIDAGYVIRHVPDAIVHHEKAPILHYRNLKGGYFDRYPFIKNHIYFALKFRECGSGMSVHEILARSRDYIEEMQLHVQDDWEAGLVSREDLDRFQHDANRAAADGIRRGLSENRQYLDPEEPNGDRQTFKHFPALLPAAQRLCLCFISNHYDSYTVDSALTFERDLAHDAARRGHHVHVITMGAQEASVDFENGVWVHRVHDTQKVPKPAALSVPRSVWDHAYRMFREVERIGNRGQIHFLQWSILGLEGIAALLEGSFVNVVSLDVPDATDRAWPGIQRLIPASWHSLSRRSVGRFCVERASHLLVKDRGILEAVAERYGTHIPEEKTCVLRHDSSSDEPADAVRRSDVDRVLRFYESLVHR